MPRHLTQRAAVSAVLLCLSFSVTAENIQDANRLFKQGQQTQALEKVNALLAKDPKDMQARYLKGVIYTRQGRTNDAIAIFQSIVADYPNIAEPYNNLGVLHASQGQYEKAKVEFETAIQLKPNYAIAHENLGDLHVKMAGTSYGYATDANRRNPGVKEKREQVKSITAGKPATPAPSLAPAAVAAVPPEAPAKPAVVAAAPVAPVVAAPVAKPAEPAVAAKPETAAAAPSKVVETKPVVAPVRPAPAPASTSFWQVLVGSHADAPKAPPAAAAKSNQAAPKPAPAVVAATPAKPVEAPAPVVAKPSPSTPAATVQSKAATPAPSIKAAEPVAAKAAPAAEKTAPVATAPAKPAAVAAPANTAKSVAAADGNTAVLNAVHGWADAWSSQDAKKYLSYYAKDFATPGGVSRSSWEAARQQRLSKPKFIKVGVEGAKVTMTDSTHATVTFKQAYQSSTLSETGNKTLVLVKSGDAWQIQEERVGKAEATSVESKPVVASAPVKPASPAPAPVVRAPTPALAPRSEASGSGDSAAIRPSMPVLPGSSRSRKATAGATDDASPLKAVQGWAAAWSAKDAERYLSYYAQDFSVPGGASRATWESTREDRLSKPKFIRVSVDDATVKQTDATHATVTFKQIYKSSSLNEVSRKTLVMVKTAAGWQIKEEAAK